MPLLEKSIRNEIIFSSKFYISLALTILIVITQIFLFHFYIGLRGSGLKRIPRIGGLQFAISSFSQGGQQSNFKSSGRFWECKYPGLNEVLDLAAKYELVLVLVDPDLLEALEQLIDETKGEEELPQFSQPFKRNQESTPGHKSIVHFALVNETSGGQPNIKLFYNALKHNGYTALKYDDASQLMQPEVYHRSSRLFDDMPLDAIREHHLKHSRHEADKKNHPVLEAAENQFYGDEAVQPTSGHFDEEDDKVSKIYTEFIAHLFILNQTKLTNNDDANCNQKHKQTMVIHIFVLYNYEYNVENQWIQPGLVMDEVDKHKLLAYNVHSFDFKVPIEHYHIHEKRRVVSVTLDSSKYRTEKAGRRKIAPTMLHLFEPEGDRMLRYANNSYSHCKSSKFNISGLIDNSRRMSNYLKSLDTFSPIKESQARDILHQQLVLAFQFMNTYSRAYGNFNYWITGSSLLAYHRHCDLACIPSDSPTSDSLYETGDIYANISKVLEDVVVNLELGVFSNEVNESVLYDLANAQAIGVVMQADWQKTNSAPIIFRFQDCPNLIFNLYVYELRRDFHQYYFITRTTMTLRHRFKKRARYEAAEATVGHHVFTANNLNLCWTRIGDSHPIRIPCNVYDHLRRIFIV